MTVAEIRPVEYLPPVRRDVDSWTGVVGEVAKLATYVADTEMVPAALRGRPAAVAAVILYGREIGLEPMTALRTSHVINGRVGIAAETMRALILSAGHDLIIRESTGTRCIVAGRRLGTERWQEVEWNLDVARRAGISLTSGSWSKYPRQMLKARASAELARDLFPDVIGGFEAREEITNETDEPQTDTARTTPVRRHRTGTDGGTSRPEPDVPPVPLPGEDGFDATEAAASEPTPETVAPQGDEPGDWNRTAAQGVKIHAGLHEYGIRDRETGLALLSRIVGREIDTTKTISRSEARVILDTFARVNASEALQASLRAAIMNGSVGDWLPVESGQEVGEPEPQQAPDDQEPPVPAADPPVAGTAYVDVPLPTDDDPT